MRLLGGLGALIGGAFVLAMALLVNGGYVYRVECPRAGGGSDTSWTYQLLSVLPYVAYHRGGCETHSATRVAFNAVGLFPIERTAVRARVDHRREYSAAQVDSIAGQCTATGDQTAQFCRCMANEFATRFSPDDYNRVVLAIRAGADRFDELPADVAASAKAAVDAVDRDC